MLGTASNYFAYPTLSHDVIREPKFVKSLIGSSAMGYGLYCIGACLCMKFNKPLARSLLVSAPASVACFGVMYSHGH